MTFSVGHARIPTMHQESSQTRQREIFKRMTPKQRVDAAYRLYWSARELKAAGLRAQHPYWADEEIQQAVKEAFMYARG